MGCFYSQYAPLRYRESNNSVFLSDGRKYSLNKIFSIVERKKTKSLDIEQLLWCLQGTVFSQQRIADCDTNVPIIITLYANMYLIVDGAHRVKKVQETGNKKITYKFITSAELEKCLVK